MLTWDSSCRCWQKWGDTWRSLSSIKAFLKLDLEQCLIVSGLFKTSNQPLVCIIRSKDHWKMRKSSPFRLCPHFWPIDAGLTSPLSLSFYTHTRQPLRIAAFQFGTTRWKKAIALPHPGPPSKMAQVTDEPTNQREFLLWLLKVIRFYGAEQQSHHWLAFTHFHQHHLVKLVG